MVTQFVFDAIISYWVQVTRSVDLIAYWCVCIPDICHERHEYTCVNCSQKTAIIKAVICIPDICHERHEYIRVNFFWPV